MAGTNVVFKEAIRGYDKEQVDLYVKKLSEAYRGAYNENRALQEKCAGLLEECEKLDAHEQTGLHPDIITKTLLDTEMLARKIIADAHAEVAKAKATAKKTLDDANSEAARIIVRAKVNFEQIQEIMEQTADKVQSLLTVDEPEAEYSAA